MLKQGLYLHLDEAILIILLPVVGICVSKLPALGIVFLYMIILVLLSHFNIERKDLKKYGDKVYERGGSALSHKCFLKFVMMQFLVLVVVWSLSGIGYQIQNGAIAYVLLNTLFLMYIFQKKMTIKVYTKGVLYKRKFYYWQNLSKRVLVKNYQDEYEFHGGYFKQKVILTRDEIKVVNRYQNQGI